MDILVGIHKSHTQSEEITQGPADSQNCATVGPHIATFMCHTKLVHIISAGRSKGDPWTTHQEND